MSEEQEASRREVLKSGLALGGLAATAGMPFWSKLALAQGEELVPFTDVPETFSAPPVTAGGFHFLDTRYIDSFYTPNDDFYIVQHYNQPEIAADDYRLRITGLVDRTLELTLAALKNRDKFEIDAGFECGGNRQEMYHGLIGNAKWGGVRLSDLLNDAGVKNSGIEVVFYGADKGIENIRQIDIEQAFGRSMHIDDAMRSDIMVAYEMNGVPLPLYHGAPVRLIVPGWYGIANVKWLENIHVQDRRYMGRFMARDYVTLSKIDVGGVVRWDERSVTRIQLKSSIVRVTRRDGSHRVTGFVLNDGTPLKSIEISIDGGLWQEAKIDAESTKYSWKLFYLDWNDASPGEHTLVSRVTDINGQVQATAEEMPEKPTRWENYAQFPRTVLIS
ncbi:MAG: molybdopterin-dependent oxidoreductase [Proteobacteria bacterium]|nr:molybdopterin-dependent oxidoreductase [Pseudomonadota bacterium]MDA0994826.1 molybdopterin-dependent oxidoreductase [Pseudomonadota bacterium]